MYPPTSPLLTALFPTTHFGHLMMPPRRPSSSNEVPLVSDHKFSFFHALSSQTVSPLVLDFSTPDKGVLRLSHTEFLPSRHSVCPSYLIDVISPRYPKPLENHSPAPTMTSKQIMGLDAQMPNDPLSQLEQQERLMVLI